MLLSTLVVPALSMSTAQADESDGTVTVRVVRDYNANGLWDATFGGEEVNEPGVEGITVELVDAEGNIVPGETDANGVATFPASADLTGGQYRVEASIPEELDYLYPAIVDPDATGANALSSHVDFVDVSDGADAEVVMGVWNPFDYTGDDPRMVSGKNHSYIWEGQPTDTSNEDSIFGFGYDSAQGTFIPNAPGANVDSKQGQTGAIWGIAAKNPDEAYASAVLRRGVKFPDAGGGTGGIYKMDGSGNVELLTVVPNAGDADHAAGPGDPAWNHDPDVALNAGKQALGDLDLSEDGSALYAVNLNTKELVVIDPATGDITETVLIQAPNGVPEDDWRPWGLAVKDGKLYVGGVDSQQRNAGQPDGAGRPSASPSAYVWEVDEEDLDFGAAELVVSETLDDERGSVSGGAQFCDGGVPCPPTYWQPWTDDPSHWLVDWVNPDAPGSAMMTHPQPILSDIDFASNGDMIFGFADRAAIQMPHQAPRWDGGNGGALYNGAPRAGDVNRACLVDGAYVWEGGAGCEPPPNQAPQQANVPLNEWYSGDGFITADPDYPAHHTGIGHPESTQGALLSIPGREWLVTNVHSVFGGGLGPSSTQGLVWLSHETGQRETDPAGHNPREAVLQQPESSAFFKGHGLMDISVMSEDAPLQIGNYLWFDDDGDGVQDPGEEPIVGVTVNLYDEDGNVVATVVTNEKGEYYFDSIDHELEPDTSYVVAVDNPADFEEGGVLDGYGPTPHLTGQDNAAGPEVNDSNGEPNEDNFAEAPVTTGDWGQNDHTTDFGFSKPSVEIIKGDEEYEASTPDDATGYEPGETRELQFEVANNGGRKLTNVVVTDRTITGGTIEELQCTFPGEDAATDGTFDDAEGMWEVRWEPSFGDPPATWDVGVSFDCTATLTMDGTDAPHADAAEVSAEVLGTGDPVEDRDDYHSFTGDVQVIKYDDRGDYSLETDDDGIPNKPLTSEPERDANSEDEAVAYPTEDGSSTGPQPVTLAVTNTGKTWLSQIEISDETLYGSDVENLTCDFSAVDPDAPSSGTSWNGPWEPGTTFYCTGELTLDGADEDAATHGDEVTVDAVVVEPEENPDYDPD
ncbi:SdrD B-like domain-containing protein, partial [Phytoactinopolyspora endophytica]|uniref:SdrD B-like domain-containing protein n=1 Tax=Phytoactinopolyspora endophytica TaxID=1642495 RepID=UPI0013EC2F90